MLLLLLPRRQADIVPECIILGGFNLVVDYVVVIASIAVVVDVVAPTQLPGRFDASV